MTEQVNRIVWYPGHELLLKDIVRAENCSEAPAGTEPTGHSMVVSMCGSMTCPKGIS